MPPAGVWADLIRPGPQVDDKHSHPAGVAVRVHEPFVSSDSDDLDYSTGRDGNGDRMLATVL